MKLQLNLLSLLLVYLLPSLTSATFLWWGNKNPTTTQPTYTCNIDTNQEKISGFRARFFSYQYHLWYSNSDQYLKSTYRTATLPQTVTYGVTHINFNQAGGFLSDLFHNNGINLGEFVAEYTSYITPKYTGDYTFKFNNINNDARLYLGSTTAFECCNSNNGVVDLKDVAYGNSGLLSWTGTVLLEAGKTYPVRIMFLNKLGPATLDASYVDPQGITHTTFEGDEFNYYMDGSNTCPSNGQSQQVPAASGPQPTTLTNTATATASA